MAISFNNIGSFSGVSGAGNVLTNPTSIAFGPDGRLYVSEQVGTINAFTVALVDGEYIATAHEELRLADGSEVVKSIQNHNDDGTVAAIGERQVTGILVAGTAANPELYVSSSDPRIATNFDSGLDTNSGMLTKVSWTGSAWEAVDLIRGLPRSEENHANNGMVLSADGSKLYLTVGGNTNNGAPSQFFAYTGEYVLSGTVLEIDLVALNALPVQIDPNGGQTGPRQYIYDLPTLDDPTVANITDGVGEDANGLDEAGPWGGNDGFNMAILPADAPLRIFADGFRNQYDIVLTQNGLYTVDNGSNGGLGGVPVVDPVTGEATNQPNDGGQGDPEPLHFIQEGGYYGHPVPVRANQDLAWSAYDDDGNPIAFPGDDGILGTADDITTITDISTLVPSNVQIADGFLIDPSRFAIGPGQTLADLTPTEQAARLFESGVRVAHTDPQTKSLVNLGSSSNGLVEYTGTAFGGALEGALLVTQFNGNVTALKLNAAGTALEPIVDPGPDGVLGTADDDPSIDDNGVLSLLSGLILPLDVINGPNDTIWVVDIASSQVSVWEPGEPNPIVDFDSDGLLNINDPFYRDASNGGSVVVFPGQTYTWDFDPNDSNLAGPSGFGGGLTGVMVNGNTNFEAFFQSDADFPDQVVKLDNVKFVTAAGGGTTVIENVSNGDPLSGSNNGAYLFHTGIKLSPTVDTFTIRWTVFNPTADSNVVGSMTGTDQQIGGYLGTGEQGNYLKFVATPNPAGEVRLVLENNDMVVSTAVIQADDLFNVPAGQKIFLNLEVNPTAATATPTVEYETGAPTNTTVTGSAIDLTGTNVLEAILGNTTAAVLDPDTLQPTGELVSTNVAVGLFSTNTESDPDGAADAFQAVFDNIEITSTGQGTVVHRLNAGGPLIVASDGGPDWLADTAFLLDPGSNSTAGFAAVDPGLTVPPDTAGEIFDTERFDFAGGPEMQYGFAVDPGSYEVRLFMGNGFGGTASVGSRVFDVAFEGAIVFDDIDLVEQFGHAVGGVLSDVVEVTDGMLNIEFLHDVIENPLINGIEIIRLGDPSQPIVSLAGGPYSVGESDGSVQIALQTNKPVPLGETVTVNFEVIPALPPAAAATQVDDYTYSGPGANRLPYGYTGQVTIAGGVSEVMLTVDIVPDGLVEGDETFVVNITDVGANAIIGTSSTTVTIVDDEVANQLSVIANLPDAAEPDAHGQFMISLDAPVTTDTVITYTVTGTATAGTDYVSLTGTVIIPMNQLSAPIDVTVIDDVAVESLETVILTLESFTGDGDILINPASNTATVAIADDNDGTVVHRVNAGGPLIAASDGGPDWLADTAFLLDPGSNSTAGFAAVDPGLTVPSDTAGEIFDTERFDFAGGPEMQYGFAVDPGSYEVRLFMGNGFGGTASVGSRVFDVALEGAIVFDDIDLVEQFGHAVGGVLSNVVEVTDGMLNIEFLHDVIENPLINGIEIIRLDDPSRPAVSLVGQPYTVGEAASQVQISLLTDVTVPADETVSVTFEIVPGTATALEDYGYVGSANATFDALTGVYTDTVTIAGSSSDVTFFVDILQDLFVEADEAFTVNITGVSANAQIGTSSSAAVTITDDEVGGGAAVLTVTLNSNNVQISNYGDNSFQITNTGNKTIAQVDIDVINALYPDSVFDPFGLAGDTASKPLTINTNGTTGVVAPSAASYVGTGGTAGFAGLRLLFNPTVDAGFNPGETLGFAIDMDPNSVAGSLKEPLDGGSNPLWDVGGVSGAELIGASFTVTFADGTTATGQLQGAGNQAGAQGLATQNSPNLPVSLTVNGLDAGEVGVYNPGGPSVFVNGPAGETARVVLTKGFIQPVIPYAQFLADQLATLATDDFPANNAVEFQTVDVVLTGEDQDISGLFDFSGVPIYDFPGEDQLPIGFVASVIDPTNNDLPRGPVTAPIYLQFEAANVVSIAATQNAAEPNANGQFTVNLSEAVPNSDTVITYSITGTATAGIDYTALTGTVTIPMGETSATIDVTVIDDRLLEADESVVVTLDDITVGAADVVLGAAQTATVAIVDDEMSIPDSVLYRVNAGGPAVVAVDGGPNWLADDTFLLDPGSDTIAEFPEGEAGPTVPNRLPAEIFHTERWDAFGGTAMQYGFAVESGSYAVRLYMGNGFVGTNAPGLRVFDVAIEGTVPTVLDDIDLAADFGHLIGGMISTTVEVTDGTLNIDFLHEVENPLINGIEIVRTLTLEAEAADVIENYSTETIATASGGTVLSLFGGDEGGSGSATFNFGDSPNEPDGTYDIILGTFAEDDTLSSFTLELTDAETNTTTEIGSLDLNHDNLIPVTSGSTLVNPTVAFGVNLTAGDSLTVNGLANALEYAQFDYLQLVPSF